MQQHKKLPGKFIAYNAHKKVIRFQNSCNYIVIFKKQSNFWLLTSTFILPLYFPKFKSFYNIHQDKNQQFLIYLIWFTFQLSFMLIDKYAFLFQINF